MTPLLIFVLTQLISSALALGIILASNTFGLDRSARRGLVKVMFLVLFTSLSSSSLLIYKLL